MIYFALVLGGSHISLSNKFSKAYKNITRKQKSIYQNN